MPTKFQIDDRVKIIKVIGDEDDAELAETVGMESTIVCIRKANSEIVYELSAKEHPFLDDFVYTDEELEKVE
jgi:hypothetical protein